MNTLRYHLLRLALCLLVVSLPARLAAQDEEPTNTATDVEVTDVDESAAPGLGVEELTIGDAAPPRELTPPKVLDVKRAIGKLEPAGVTIFTRVFNIDSAAGINELFQQCRALDKAVAQRGKGRNAVGLEQAYESELFQKRVGAVRVRSAHFTALGPKRAVFLIKGRRTVFEMDDVLKKLVEAAEATYARATEHLAMGQFMNWVETPGRIYVVTDEEAWKKLGGSSERGEPVETVICEPERREFFVYVNADTYDYANQALSYEVALTLLQEYAIISTARPTAMLPLFYRTGLAAYYAGLEAVIRVDGPKQVDVVKLPQGPVRVRRPKPGKLLPVKSGRLYSLDEMVSATAYPTGDEELYTFVRQCETMAEVISTNAPLATVALTQALSGGKDFRDQIVLSYMEMQRDIQARPVPGAPQKKSVRDEEGRQVRPDYLRFAKYMDLIFNTLTEEHVIEDWQRRRDEKAKAAQESPLETAEPKE